MSHKATNWAFELQGLKPAAKLLLLCLADRHNPDHGCFPSQETLARDACMSRTAVNANLKVLEAAGHIRRFTDRDPRTNRQRPTRYILAFEETPEPDVVEKAIAEGSEGGEEPCAESGPGAVCGSTAEPCADSRKSRVRNPHTNPVRVTYNLTRARDPAFAEFVAAYPGASVDAEKVGEAWDAAIAEGANPARLVVLANRVAGASRGGAPRMQAAYWLRSGQWRGKSPYPASASPDDLARFWAEKLKAGAFVAKSALSAETLRRIVVLELLSPEELRAKGFFL